MATTKEALAKVIKRLGTADKLPSIPALARETGDTLDGKYVALCYSAEPIAFPELKLPATQKGVADGRRAGLRFERIAARTGLSIGQVREYAEKAGVADLYTGRGRKIGTGASAGKSTAAASSGRRRGANAAKAADETPKRGTSGRRGAKATPAAAPARGRRGTRASANPK